MRAVLIFPVRLSQRCLVPYGNLAGLGPRKQLLSGLFRCMHNEELALGPRAHLLSLCSGDFVWFDYFSVCLFHWKKDVGSRKLNLACWAEIETPFCLVMEERQADAGNPSRGSCSVYFGPAPTCALSDSYTYPLAHSVKSDQKGDNPRLVEAAEEAHLKHEFDADLQREPNLHESRWCSLSPLRALSAGPCLSLSAANKTRQSKAVQMGSTQRSVFSHSTAELSFRSPSSSELNAAAQYEYFNAVLINERDKDGNFLELGKEFILAPNDHFNNLPVNISLSDVQVPTNMYNKGLVLKKQTKLSLRAPSGLRLGVVLVCATVLGLRSSGSRGSRLPPDPAIVNGVYWSESLNKVFVDNFDRDPSLIWQYFGSAKGFFRQYPGIKWEPDENGVIAFDCRNRKWYIQAATSPKDVVILVDVSGSMKGLRLTIAKQTVSSILDTLGDDDFFNIIALCVCGMETEARGCSDCHKVTVPENVALYSHSHVASLCATDPEKYNEELHYVEPCLNGTLVQADRTNKEHFREHLDKLFAKGIGMLDIALNEAFNILSDFNHTGQGSICSQALMLITDGAVDTYDAIFAKHNWPDRKRRREAIHEDLLTVFSVTFIVKGALSIPSSASLCFLFSVVPSCMGRLESAEWASSKVLMMDLHPFHPTPVPPQCIEGLNRSVLELGTLPRARGRSSLPSWPDRGPLCVIPQEGDLGQMSLSHTLTHCIRLTKCGNFCGPLSL
ncbi:Voltage-dependent calcium channel subunit alpha-2/delta-3 [Fukomys damarensis]|uniref:Voltage-dependent calcium channel subunit alpha-2/delta-3 n=1 Tax=Fukomys damarensis TaxID=885580 RepID=A0A091D4M9_FUKDA|nr:Voltage-dependent calcium channel subunit alpha-2/delta-3 [Fukomys damarensis]